MPRTVFIVVGQGLSQRCLLETDILDMFLAAGLRVVALVPDPEEPYLQERIASRGVVLEKIRRKDPTKKGKGGFTRAGLAYLRRYAVPGHRSPAFLNRFLIKNVKYEKESRWPRFYATLSFLVRTVMWRSRIARRAVSRLDQRANPENGHADLFERYQPSLAVAGTLGHVRWDGIVLREAQQRGIGVASALISWDNVSSKEYRMFRPDLLIAWSEEMAEQVRRFQDVSRKRIFVGGAYHWDRYVRPGALLDRGTLLSDLGLDPDRKLVLFAAPPPKSYVAAGRMAEHLARAAQNGAFGVDAQLVVRMHPNSFTQHSDNPVVQQMESVAKNFRHAVLSAPEIVSKRLGGAVSREDQIILGSLIKHADVVVNQFSTTTLEAFLAGTPVVLFNDDVGLTPEELAEATAYRSVELVHLARVKSAARVATSLTETIDHVATYLADPELDRAARAEIARLECGPMDGFSARRAAEQMLVLAGLSAQEIENARISMELEAGAAPMRSVA